MHCRYQYAHKCECSKQRYSQRCSCTLAPRPLVGATILIPFFSDPSCITFRFYLPRAHTTGYSASAALSSTCAWRTVRGVITPFSGTRGSSLDLSAILCSRVHSKHRRRGFHLDKRLVMGRRAIITGRRQYCDDPCCPTGRLGGSKSHCASCRWPTVPKFGSPSATLHHRAPSAICAPVPCPYQTFFPRSAVHVSCKTVLKSRPRLLPLSHIHI